jgi:hypothetical protein
VTSLRTPLTVCALPTCGNAAQIEVSLIEAAKCSLDLVIRCELATLRLSDTFQDSGQMCRIDCFRLSLVTGQCKHGMCDFVLAAGR